METKFILTKEIGKLDHDTEGHLADGVYLAVGIHFDEGVAYRSNHLREKPTQLTEYNFQLMTAKDYSLLDKIHMSYLFSVQF